MKKNIITSIILSAVIASTSAVFASKNEPILTAPVPAENEIITGTPQITVNGEAVDLSTTNLSQYIFSVNENVMVPVRAVAEKMGFTVDWNGEKQSVTVGNDSWEVVLQIGADSYYGVTKIKDAVGMTALQSYGAAPQIVENTTFVPAKMFELIDYKCSTIGQFVNFEPNYHSENEDISNPVQIPNPFVSYEDISTAKKALNFEPSLPAYIPEGFILDDISVTGNDFLQIIYRDNNDNSLSFRTAKVNYDISGDYNTYSNTETMKINSIDVTLKGNGNLYYGASWSHNGEAFSVYCNGIQKDTMLAIIESVN